MVDQETLAPYLMMMTKKRKTLPAPMRITATFTGQSPEEPSTNLRISLRKTSRIMRAAIYVMMTPKWRDQSVLRSWVHRMSQALMKLRSRI